MLFFITSYTVQAQEILDLNTSRKCVFGGYKIDEELYGFEPNQEVVDKVKEILQLGNAEQNFKLIQSNVETVAAIIDNGKRYILYSLDFIQKSQPIDIYEALAHEIGHHVNVHTLNDIRYKIEETEANMFMGFIMSKKGFSKNEVVFHIAKRISPNSAGEKSNSVNLNEAILEGYEKAEKALKINTLPFDTDIKNNELSLPSFPFPPPSCFGRFEIPNQTFSGLKNLGELDKKLEKALNQGGFTQRSYFSVPNGFAVVTQMEQYNGVDATLKNDKTRWLDYPKKEKFEGIMDYLTSIIMPQRGYFRLFVFIVTNQGFGGSQKQITKSEASAWLNQGFNKLPNTIKNIPYTEGYDVTCLVYEFEVPESNRKPKQHCPSPRFDAKFHLQKAGIAQSLGF